MKSIRRRSALFLALFIAVSLLYALFRFVFFPLIGWTENMWLDFPAVFYPALTAPDPYATYGYFNPPWLLWLMKPLALLPWPDAWAVWTAVMVLLTMRCITALGGGLLALILVMTSPPMLEVMLNGQVDPLVLLGLVTGSWLLILIKPQVVGMALVDHLMRGRIQWTAVAVILLSFALYGLWFIIPDSSRVILTNVDFSPFPYALPLGLGLFLLARLRQDLYLAALSTIFVTPYIGANSLLVYSAVITSRYGRLVAIIWTAAMWALAFNRFG